MRSDFGRIETASPPLAPKLTPSDSDFVVNIQHGSLQMISVQRIIELNIEHYRKLLENETDASKRERITKLLAEEEPKLAKLVAKEPR
jgi:hypothetical protein